MKPANFSFRSYQNVLIITLLVLFGQQAFSQFSCDSIQLGTIQYAATNADVIEVQAMTISNDCVSYPSFVLYDQNGDTLAVEIVNFFCVGIVNFSSHPLNVLSGAVIPSGSFDATLELFSGFGGSLVCSWDLTLELCPPDSCTQAQIYLTNTGVLEAGNVYWSLSNTDNTFYANGIITMDLVDHTHLDTICLPPGNYDLFVSPFSDIWVDEDYILGVTPNYYYSIGTNTAQQNDSTPQDLMFHWYEACVPMSNSIEELSAPTFTVLQRFDELIISSVDNQLLGRIQLFDLQGRMLKDVNAISTRARFNVSGLSAGIYIVRNLRKDGNFKTQRLFIR